MMSKHLIDDKQTLPDDRLALSDDRKYNQLAPDCFEKILEFIFPFLQFKKSDSLWHGYTY
jgi:hypothetical protein